MSQRLLVATTNKGKLSEVTFLLKQFDIQIVSLNDIAGQIVSDAEETGDSFAENAQIKARHFALQSHLPTLAEDSGLSVTSLRGDPGIFSARWFPGTDTDRCRALLSRMEGIVNRSAQFICVTCLYNPNTQTQACFRGEVDGTIAWELSGVAGFGYDPIFVPKGYNQSFASLGDSIKNSLSHRNHALQQVKKYFQQNPNFFDL